MKVETVDVLQATHLIVTVPEKLNAEDAAKLGDTLNELFPTLCVLLKNEDVKMEFVNAKDSEGVPELQEEGVEQEV